jgi:hypothetical protein
VSLGDEEPFRNLKEMRTSGDTGFLVKKAESHFGLGENERYEGPAPLL